jgi:hypothetical protein
LRKTSFALNFCCREFLYIYFVYIVSNQHSFMSIMKQRFRLSFYYYILKTPYSYKIDTTVTARFRVGEWIIWRIWRATAWRMEFTISLHKPRALYAWFSLVMSHTWWMKSFKKHLISGVVFFLRHCKAPTHSQWNLVWPYIERKMKNFHIPQFFCLFDCVQHEEQKSTNFVYT